MENNDSELDLIDAVQRASMVSEMIRTRGWTDVVRPALIRAKTDYLDALLFETEHVKMILIQQQAKAIDNLINFVETVCADGAQAELEYRRRHGLSGEHPELIQDS